MTDLVSLKYFIVLNILFLLFGSSWEGIYLLKHFKNKKIVKVESLANYFIFY